MINTNNIPQELRHLNQWVCWKYVLKPGKSKPDKVPFSPYGGHAKTDDPSTWSNFDTAVKSYVQNGYDGVGIVLTKRDPYVGVDIDPDCPPNLKNRIITALDSYTEISPGGRGVHIFAKGNLRPGRRKCSEYDVELYEDGRYLTVTGNIIETGFDRILPNRTEKLAQIHSFLFPPEPPKPNIPRPVVQSTPDDERIINLMMRNPQLNDLWHGNWKPHQPSPSEADMRLCTGLAWFVGPDLPERVYRLFCQSGLYRPEKADRSARTGETYLSGTIARAIEGLGRRRHDDRL